MERVVIWSGEGVDQDGDWHVEFARVDFGSAGLSAVGTQLGAVPVPYRLDYELDATVDGFVTRSLQVEAVGEGWERRLRLERGEDGEWSIDVEAAGDTSLEAPGGDAGLLTGALDCDLGLSPLTNAMPVHRHSLHSEPGEKDFVMAWVLVPDLAVHASSQRYKHLRQRDGTSTVRFENFEDGEVAFTSDLEFSDDGLISVYPKLAKRIAMPARF